MGTQTRISEESPQRLGQMPSVMSIGQFYRSSRLETRHLDHLEFDYQRWQSRARRRAHNDPARSLDLVEIPFPVCQRDNGVRRHILEIPIPRFVNFFATPLNASHQSFQVRRSYQSEILMFSNLRYPPDTHSFVRHRDLAPILLSPLTTCLFSPA